MLYRVLGHSRDNGQKMTLEIEARSKADAERQGERQNLKIIRVEPVNPDADDNEKPWQPVATRRNFRMPWLWIILLAAVVAGFYYWPTISTALRSALPAHSPSRPAASEP